MLLNDRQPPGGVERITRWQNAVVRFRAGLLIGAAAGYVLGARAGHERYEQIKRVAVQARRHPAVAQLAGQATGVTDLMRNLVAGGLDAGSKGLRDVAARNG
jgi:hypothetical protein